jgi:hypothetical protein
MLRVVYLVAEVVALLMVSVFADKLDSFVIDRAQCQSSLAINTGRHTSLDELEMHNIRSDCLKVGGLQSSGDAVSKTSVAALSNHLGKNGFSLELWIQPKQRLSSTAPIISIGADKVSDYPCANNVVVRPRCTERIVQ